MKELGALPKIYVLTLWKIRLVPCVGLVGSDVLPFKKLVGSTCTHLTLLYNLEQVPFCGLNVPT